MRKWLEMTGIYVIGNRHPVAVFLHENQAVEWAEAHFPGEWIKKRVKIPPLPVTPKTSRTNLKDIAAKIDSLDWTLDDDDDEEDGSGEHGTRVYTDG